MSTSVGSYVLHQSNARRAGLDGFMGKKLRRNLRGKSMEETRGCADRALGRQLGDVILGFEK